MVQDNFYQSFALHESNLRGRVVRLGSVLDDILSAHDYPLPVAHLVGEMITLTVLLSSMLKYDGVFTLQTQGDGPLKMLVSDMVPGNIVRGCASFDPERFERARQQLSALKTVEGENNHLAQYLGKGYMAFTVDQGVNAERYQGIVELKGASLVDCVQHYFSQSEQIGTGIKMSVGMRDGKWRAGGIMLQHLPEDMKNPQAGIGNTQEDDWRRVMALMETYRDDEALDTQLSAQEMLYRLFHEEGVIVYTKHKIDKGCRCDEQRVHSILMTMSEEDISYMAVDGVIEMVCEFCSTAYRFDPDQVRHEIQQRLSEKESKHEE